jgi:Undecaprenyl-phosphate glucose phosphotransferase
MTVVHVPDMAPQSPIRGVVHVDPGNSGQADDGARPSRKISPQSWVAVFLLFDVLLLAGLSLLPTIPAHRLFPDLYTTPFFTGQIEAIAVAIVVYLLSAHGVRLYRTRRIFDARSSVQRSLLALVLTFAFMMALGAATKTTHDYSRLWFFTWLVASLLVLPAFRIVALRGVAHSLRNGHYVHRALSVGIGSSAPVSETDLAHASHGHVRAEQPLQLRGVEELILIADEIRLRHIDKLYIRAPWNLVPQISSSLGELRNLSADVYVIPESFALNSNLIGADQLCGNVSLQITDRPIDGWSYWLKRMQDVSIASLAIVLLSPLLAAIAAAIRLESNGPILFRQRRMGFNGQTFELWKFRSMYAHRSDPGAAQQTIRNDSRVTRVGRFIRKTSLDELPQLFNVLQGTMSIVGPRPHALHTTAEGKMLHDAIDNYAARHRVKPGITGWAQINGLRGELTSIEQLSRRVDYDRDYIRRWSMMLDIKIILLTFARIAHDPNAY